MGHHHLRERGLIYRGWEANPHFTPDLFNIKFSNVKYCLNYLSVLRINELP